MPQSTDRQSTVTAVAVVCGMLCAISVCRVGLSTDIPSPASVNGDSALIKLTQTGSAETPIYHWSVNANQNGFFVNDDDAVTTPFEIYAGSPDSSLVLRKDGTGDANVGIGGAPANGVHLQVNGAAMPVIRMAQSEAPFYEWDIRANDLFWSVWDVKKFTSPFLIEVGAPDGSMWIAPNGSIGLGTSQPNSIGAVNAAGKFFNLRADGLSAATGVANGVFQGQLGAQNHFVHLGAAANQQIMRLQTSSGFTGFHVVNDDLASYAVANVLSMKMSNGNVGLRVQNPAHPLHLVSGARCTLGGVWTHASSRGLKQDIEPVTSKQAREALRALQPVAYRYKNEPDEQYVGFIAEDVPELVAAKDRKSLAAMDITAVLAKVVQDQDRQLIDQSRQLVAVLQRDDELEQSVESLMRRLTDLEQQRNRQPSLAK